MDARGAAKSFRVAFASATIVFLSACGGAPPSGAVTAGTPTPYPSESAVHGSVPSPILTTSAAAPPTLAPAAGRIAFTRQVAAGDELFVIRPDGSGEAPVLPKGSFGGVAAWRPDGGTLLFDSDQASTTPPGGTGFHIDLYTIAPSGGAPRALTRKGLNEKGSWSHDGRLIAFERSDADLSVDHIAIMNADGSHVRDVTSNPFGYTDEDPTFSPDGSRLVFQRHRTGAQSALFLLTLASHAVKQLTSWDSQAGQPEWSPDGQLILFNTGSDDDNAAAREVELIRPDGSKLERLASGYVPTWSPDGSKIAYIRDGHLWVMNRDGSGAAQITTGSDPENDPSWGP